MCLKKIGHKIYLCVLDCVTHCFTAAYGRQLHRATGSLLLMDAARSMSVADMAIDRSDMKKFAGKLRQFSPYELLRVFSFPDSVNVAVISHLASFLLKNINDEIT